eukprot:13897116-Heterocapsa_arctica.AAC.1
MVNSTRSGATWVGYIMYESKNKQNYAMNLDVCIANTEAKWSNMTKGLMTDCIFALGYLYQANICPELKGIMDIVVFIENMEREPTGKAMKMMRDQLL